MTSPSLLFQAVARYTDAHAHHPGVLPTAIPGMTVVRATEPSGLLHAISHPLVCLVLQGSKQVTMGAQAFVTRSRELAQRHGARFEPAAIVVKMAQEGGRFEDVA